MSLLVARTTRCFNNSRLRLATDHRRPLPRRFEHVGGAAVSFADYSLVDLVGDCHNTCEWSSAGGMQRLFSLAGKTALVTGGGPRIER